MALFFKRKKRRALSIDVGTASVKVLVSEGASPGEIEVLDYRLLQVGTAGKPLNAPELVSVLREMLSSLHVHISDTRATFSNRQVVVRVVEMPRTQRNEYKKAAEFQLNRYIPMNAEEAVFDCVPLPDAPCRDGWSKCVLAASRRTVVDQFTDSLRQAGLTPLLLDVEPVCVMNAFIATADEFDRDKGIARVESGGVGLVHIGATHTDLCVLQGRIPIACRVIECGAGDVVQELTVSKRVDYQAAQQLLREPGEEDAARNKAVEKVLARLANEIKTSLEYCAREFELKSERLYLTGGLADCPEAAGLVGSLTALPTFRFDPFVNARLGPLDTRVGDLRAMAASFVPVMGLAVRELTMP
ncbi:pilus assembly protein PilM [bacterium]|nr:pilus assembly protein PilM [bacterium]